DGVTWSQSNVGLNFGGAPFGILDIIVRAGSPPTLIVAAAAFDGVNYANIRKSTDGGATFNTVPGLPNRSAKGIASDPAAADTYYTNLEYPARGLFRSTDAGDNWSAFDTTLKRKRVNQVASGASTKYVGSDGGVYRSTAGDAWSASNTGLRAANVSNVRSPKAGLVVASSDA